MSDRLQACTFPLRSSYRNETRYLKGCFVRTFSRPRTAAAVLPLPPPSKRPAEIWKVCFHAASVARGAHRARRHAHAHVGSPGRLMRLCTSAASSRTRRRAARYSIQLDPPPPSWRGPRAPRTGAPLPPQNPKNPVRNRVDFRADPDSPPQLASFVNERASSKRNHDASLPVSY